MSFLKKVFGNEPAERPHDDPNLESELPPAIGGRQLARWSVRGERAFTLGTHDLKPGDRADIAADLQEVGLTIGDVSMAFAGRAAPSDPPYAVRVWRFDNRPATELPLDLGIEGKGMEGWQSGLLGNQYVMRGTTEMIQQTRSARGRPYVVQSGPLHFSIVTDDERWAEEVCRALPITKTSAAESGRPLTDPQAAIEEAIQRLAASEGRFAIFEVPGGRNIYAQVVIGESVDELHGELVGNQYLDAADRLDEHAKARLVNAGWTAMAVDDNFAREWSAWTQQSDRSSVAGDILDGLSVFGSKPSTLWIAIGSRD